jgi:segregation and condensation protein A
MMEEIKLEKFEGPLDLLLQLVELEKLSITDVSLSKITEQFLKYIEKLEKDSSDELSDFLVIATKLVYMKSRILLPYLQPEEDSGPSLADQLKMYKQYVEASKKIKILWENNQISYGRAEPVRRPKEFILPMNARIVDLKEAMERVVVRLRPLSVLPKIIIDRAINIKDKVRIILQMLGKIKKMRFAEITENSNKTELIISFLALLELMRDNKANTYQKNPFAEMIIEKI